MVPESPEYLYSYYKFDECREILRKIALWNEQKKDSKNDENGNDPNRGTLAT
jgi:hypothetical protein